MTSSQIKNVIVGKTISVYFKDGTKVATMKPHRLMEYLSEIGQWTFTVERTMDEEALKTLDILKEATKADVTVTGDKTFKFKVKKEFIKASTAPVENKTYIRLGRDAIFDNAAAAFEHVRTVEKKEAPAGIMVGLTKTFDRGTVEGQIKSVFSDVINYGLIPAVAKKVTDFARITAENANYDSLRKAVKEGASAAEGYSVNTTFKFLYLVTTAEELASTEAAAETKEEAPAEKAA